MKVIGTIICIILSIISISMIFNYLPRVVCPDGYVVTEIVKNFN